MTAIKNCLIITGLTNEIQKQDLQQRFEEYGTIK